VSVDDDEEEEVNVHEVGVDVADPYGHGGAVQMYSKKLPKNVSEQAVTGSIDETHFNAAAYMSGVDGDLETLRQTKDEREYRDTRTKGGRGTRQSEREYRDTRRHGRSRTRASDVRGQGQRKTNKKSDPRRFTDGSWRVAVAMEDEDEVSQSRSHQEGDHSTRSPSETEDNSETRESDDDEKSVSGAKGYAAYHNITNSDFAKLQKAITSARTKDDFQRLERIIRNGLIPNDNGGYNADESANVSVSGAQRANLMPDLVRMRQISETIQSVYNNLPNMESRKEERVRRDREKKRRRRRGKGGRGSDKRPRAKDFMPVLDEDELAVKLNQLSLAAAGVLAPDAHGHGHNIAISPINREYISEMEDLEDM